MHLYDPLGFEIELQPDVLDEIWLLHGERAFLAVCQQSSSLKR